MKYLCHFFLFLAMIGTSIAGESYTYSVTGQLYEGYYVSPRKEAPLVLLLHDWDGLTEYEIKRAEMLASHGYNVFAADLFGAGVRPTEVVDKKQHTGELYNNRNKLRKLITGALEAAQTKGLETKRTVVMGYCFGGAAALEFARSGADIKGFVTFHGGLGTPPDQDYSAAKGRYLIFHGTADAVITMDDFAELAEELEDNNLDHEMISYGGAPHAFTVFHSKKYHAGADKKSWGKFLEFLAEM